jgi:type VI secretion system secreted protein VgrG
MARAPKQDDRPVRLETPFGKDVLSFLRLDAREGLSDLFDFSVEAVSSEAGLDFDRALGRNCCVTYRTHGSVERHFNGVLTGAEWLGKTDGLHHYRLHLEPWLALLSYQQNCRFFKEMNVIDILKQVFSEGGFSDYVFRTGESYDPIEYCVQYRETNLHFVRRLMERYGIYFFFEHTQDKHELVLADGRSSHQPLAGLPRVPMRHSHERSFREEQYLAGWKPTRRFETGKVSLNDYDYLKPNAQLLAEAAKPGGYSRASLEHYDYHADYTERGLGEKFAKIQVEAMQSFDFRREGWGDAPSITAGGLVDVTDLDASGENGQYLVVSCQHAVQGDTYSSRGAPDATPGYEGRYLFQPVDRPYRAPARTVKPLIAGLQTAKVVGKEGEEIDVDEHGRILVQFHWDRDKKPSRRVRVAQSWAGNAWGGIVIPRIGMEVVVEFVEGDPDYPLVTGTVYNGNNAPPFALPENKTISGVKSRSSKNDNGYNELIFEDKTDQEKIRMHGEKDLEVKIKNSAEWEIASEFAVPRGRTSHKRVVKKGDDELTVETGDQKVRIGASQSVDVTERITITAGMMITIQCGQSKITMTPASIAIDSPMITLNGTATISASAPMTSITGSGLLSLSGALVKIN